MSMRGGPPAGPGMGRGFHGPGGMGTGMPPARSKHFRATSGRLPRRLQPDSVKIALACLVAAVSVALAVLGPKILGNATNLIFEGVISKQIPTGGRVLVDGTDIAHLSAAQLRAQIGCVPQDIQLFTGSVRENIAMGVADKDPGRVVAIVIRELASHSLGSPDDLVITPEGGADPTQLARVMP